jgi:hypothetical protein
MAQILVKVRDISVDDRGVPTELHGNERIITYKAFLFKSDAYELIAQVDESGNQIPGNPNLGPQHRPLQNQSGAGHVDNSGVNQALQEENARLRAALAQQVTSVPVTPSPIPPVQQEVQRRKPGRKPKEEVTEQVA